MPKLSSSCSSRASVKSDAKTQSSSEENGGSNMGRFTPDAESKLIETV